MLQLLAKMEFGNGEQGIIIHCKHQEQDNNGCR